MSTLKTLITLLVLSLVGVVVSSPPESLRLVSVLYRHGDRSPASIYPKDINQVPNAWPDGLGWLSNIGKLQQYELGQYIKQRYDGFINTTYYHHDQILIQSSGVERCLMSAYSNLAGLFPPQDSQIWKDGLPWQPIPVETTPEETDNKLSENANCPRYEQLYNDVLKSPEVRQEEKENKAFYDMVEEGTGIKQESIKDVWQVIDALVCERAHNLTWNSWVTPQVWKKLDALRNFGFELLYKTQEMARLKGGPLLKEIIDHMEKASTEDEPLPKFYMYSAHDTTVSSLLRAMEVYDNRQPIYRALVMVELHQINEEYVVKIFYRNDTTRDPYELIPKACGKQCTLDTFIAATKESVPGNWTEECMAQSSWSSSGSLTPASWIALVIGITLCVVIAVGLVVMLVRIKHHHSTLYSKL